jgi:adenine-specific DNA-methyltransferase
MSPRSQADSRAHQDAPRAPSVQARAGSDGKAGFKALSIGEELKEKARGLAEATPPKLRLLYAQAFCAEVLTKYWAKLRPHCRQALRSPPQLEHAPRLRNEGLGVADALASAASELGVDEASYLVGRTYAAMLPEDYRSTNGVFYTPPAVVRRLLDSATEAGVDWKSCRVLDPACGGGAFVGPLARRMVASLKGSDRRFVLRSLSTRLKGYEIDSFAAWMSAVFLDATLNEELGFAGDESFAPIEVCDSLIRDGAEPEFDLIVANPPYGRVKLTAELREVYKRSLYGHANLYGLFLDLALRKAKPGAVIAYVTPTSVLCGEYFKNLRALLGREAPPFALEFISERSGVFDDVLQETLLAVFHRNQCGVQARVNFVEVSSVSGLKVTEAGGVPLANPPEEPWLVPREPSAAPLVVKLRSMSNRLAEWGYGVSTGPLVWNRFKGQLREHPEAGTVPLIWAEAVTADGEFSFRAARRNHSPYFAVQDGDDALLVRQSCVLLQRTTAKEQPRRLVAAELPQKFLDTYGGAVTVENHLNMVVAITPNPPVDTRTLAAFLNSSAADRVFRCISGTVAVSAYELEAMPMPSPWSMRGLTEIISGTHVRADIEAYCNRLYGDR